MGNDKVETVLSNDGKTRLKGNVGSHSTLVTQAKAPTTDINKVNIPGKTKLVEAKETENKIHVFDKKLSSLDEAKAYLDEVTLKGLFASDTFDYGYKNYDIAKAELEELEFKKEAVEAIIAEKTTRDEMTKAEAEATEAVNKNPEYIASHTKLTKMLESNSYTADEHIQAANELNSILEEDENITKADKKMLFVSLEYMIVKERCETLGITKDQLLP